MRLLSEKLRASPRYELVPYGELSESERLVLRPLTRRADFFGILRPSKGGTLAIKAVFNDTAELLLALREPSLLPPLVDALSPPQFASELEKLVLDGIIEIGVGDKFLSGSDAYVYLYDGMPPERTDPRDAPNISIRALRYGQRLAQFGLCEPRLLSARLYFFNRFPVTPRWRAKIPDRAGVLEFLRLADLRPLLERYWTRPSQDTDETSWATWRHKNSRTLGDDQPLYKLYISPTPELLADTLSLALPVLSEYAPHAFKVGIDLYSVLRPDKLIAYFYSKEDLLKCAEQLRGLLASCCAHAVPFTAELATNGLLSWGVDPPALALLPNMLGSEAESWRLWLTNRLATALLTAMQTNDQAVEPWRFALERIHMEGIDPVTFAPFSLDFTRTDNAAQPKHAQAQESM